MRSLRNFPPVSLSSNRHSLPLSGLNKKGIWRRKCCVNQHCIALPRALIITRNCSKLKLVMKILTMSDDKTKKKTMEAAADILGVDSIAVDVKEQTLTVIGEMDIVVMVKKVKKSVGGHVEILSFGPNKEESK